MEDIQIIDLYIQRAESAIYETDIKYGKLCRKLAMNILSNREDTEECVNDTYLGTWNAIPPHQPLSLCAFISKITRNLALKKYEYLSAKRRNPQVTVSLSELEDCVSGSNSVEDAVENGRLVKTISDFLRALDYESRNVFLRRYWFFDSISVISKQFNFSESKVTSMLFRTRRKLQACLQRESIEI